MNKDDLVTKGFFLVIYFAAAAVWMVVGHMLYYFFNAFAVGAYYRELVLGIQPVTVALVIYWISTGFCSLVIVFLYDYWTDKKTEMTLTLSVVNLFVYVVFLILWGIYYGFTHYPL